MRLVIGLGNPDAKYADTRHNVGFQVLDVLARRWGWAFGPSRFDGLVAEGHRFHEKVALVKPQTYMNRSGDCVAPMARYFRVEPEDMLVVYDDVDLPLGQLRLRAQGSAGSHNGMKSVIEHLGTTAFPRLRIGIERRGRRANLTGHVLGKFSADERPAAASALQRAADCVERVLSGDWTGAMNTYNERLQPLDDTPKEG